MADEVDFKLIGDDLQGVIITLDPGEAVVAEAGAFMYMENGIRMATTLDTSGSKGLFGKLLAGGKRMLSGDSFFITLFANDATTRQDVAFASPYPGKIKPVELSEWGGEIIAQKDSFLCGARGIDVSIAFSRRIGAGFFGGEGFILQRISGRDGLCFLHASGALHELSLKPGERLRVDTGCIVAMQNSVDYDIQMVPGVKTALFGGEGLFFAQLTGPGKVILQTLPFSRLADRIIAAAPRAGGGRREEGSLLGGLGGILDGDP